MSDAVNLDLNRHLYACIYHSTLVLVAKAVDTDRRIFQSSDPCMAAATASGMIRMHVSKYRGISKDSKTRRVAHSRCSAEQWDIALGIVSPTNLDGDDADVVHVPDKS